MTFLKNAWTIAAWIKELPTEGTLFHRTLLGQPVVFYRRANGTLAALADRCPHRFAPLHMGQVVDDALQCAYHGLRFDATGACVHNPHGDCRIPAAAKVAAYPVIERHLAVWIWMGDAALADPALIPDYSFLEAALATARNTGYLPTRANYQLLADNIMDLSHVDYLHPTTLGGGSLTRAQATVTEQGDRVLIRWDVKQDSVPPAFAQLLPDPSATADQWTEVVWTAPGLMELCHYIEQPGHQMVTRALHMMTPETETTTHYFYANTRNYLADDDAYNRQFDTVFTAVFTHEDKPMAEAQQRNMGGTDLLALKPVLLAPDAGAMRARRKLAALLAKEQAAA